jgi:hypothetical protein
MIEIHPTHTESLDEISLNFSDLHNISISFMIELRKWMRFLRVMCVDCDDCFSQAPKSIVCSEGRPSSDYFSQALTGLDIFSHTQEKSKPPFSGEGRNQEKGRSACQFRDIRT